MSYKVDTIAPFRKEAKTLIKKPPSLKNELAELGQQLSADPTAGTPSAITATRYAWQLPQREKVSPAGQE